MCEQYVAVSVEPGRPFRIGDLWPMTERLERFGLAGFGWGAAWLDEAGRLRTHREIGSFREDRARGRVGSERTAALLVHLRRPSRFSTIGIPDTQPFDDPAGRFAVSHNGDLANDRAFRGRYAEAGRLHGRADSEVGARWLEDEWETAATPAEVLARFHDTFGGRANLAVLTRDGDAYHYAGNDENPVFTFDLEVDDGSRVRLACTGMYSLDRSLFRYVVPEAANRRLVRPSTTATLRPQAVAAG